MQVCNKWLIGAIINIKKHDKFVVITARARNNLIIVLDKAKGHSLMEADFYFKHFSRKFDIGDYDRVLQKYGIQQIRPKISHINRYRKISKKYDHKLSTLVEVS